MKYLLALISLIIIFVLAAGLGMIAVAAIEKYKYLRRKQKLHSLRQSAHNTGKAFAVEPGTPATSDATKRANVIHGINGVTADRAVYHQMIPAFGLTLKKCALVLNKFFALLHCQKLSLHFAMLFFKAGIFLLQFFNAMFETRSAFFNDIEVFPQDGIEGQSGQESSEFIQHNKPQVNDSDLNITLDDTKAKTDKKLNQKQYYTEYANDNKGCSCVVFNPGITLKRIGPASGDAPDFLLDGMIDPLSKSNQEHPESKTKNAEIIGKCNRNKDCKKREQAAKGDKYIIPKV